MKAYLIDPTTKSISEVDFNGDYRQIYTLIGPGVTTFTTVMINDERDTIFLDDEGFLHSKNLGWFRTAGYHQLLAGKGLVLGTNDEGDSTEPSISLEELKNSISFEGPPTEEQLDKILSISRWILDK
jgi:hypothetical protein